MAKRLISKDHGEEENNMQKAEILISAIHHHTEEINRRLTWMCQLQGLLFAALGFAWPKHQGLIVFLSGIGISVAALMFKSLACSSRNMHRTNLEIKTFKELNIYIPDCYDSEEAITPKVQCKEYFSPENCFTILFIVGWLIILIHAYSQHSYGFWITVIIASTILFLVREIWIAWRANARTSET